MRKRAIALSHYRISASRGQETRYNRFPAF